AYDIRTTCECDDPDSIVGPAFNKLACDFADRVDTGRFLSADRKILGQHRSGDIERENNVDPTGLDLCKTLAELRTRQRDHEDSKRSQKQCSQNFPRTGGAFFSDRPKACCG